MVGACSQIAAYGQCTHLPLLRVEFNSNLRTKTASRKEIFVSPDPSYPGVKLPFRDSQTPLHWPYPLTVAIPAFSAGQNPFRHRNSGASTEISGACTWTFGNARATVARGRWRWPRKRLESAQKRRLREFLAAFWSRSDVSRLPLQRVL